MDYEKAIARVYEHLEKNDVEKAVMACLRIARAAKDYLNAAVFLRELYPDKGEVARALYDDTSHLNREAQKFLFETSLNRWLEAHTIDLHLPEDEGKADGDKHNLLKVAAGELDSEIEQWNAAINDFALPPGMGEYDTAAFTDRFVQHKADIRQRIKALVTIRARLKTRCLNYAIGIERQLGLQTKGQGFLEAVQNEVNNYFKARSDDVFLKLQKAAQLAASADLEDFSLLMTEVRRALKASADFFYPPVSGIVECADGKMRELGDEQYLNRLHEFVARRLSRSTSKELIDAELEYLAAFFRRLNEMASKGVHGSVTLAESRQGLVGLYFFLFNISQHLSKDAEQQV
jgi:hypothetical protein